MAARAQRGTILRVSLVLLLVLLAVIAAIAVVAAGRGGGLGDVEPGPLARGVLPDGDVDRATVDGLRFTLALRGYRMDEVDDVLDRLVDELERRGRADRRAREPRLAEPPSSRAEPSGEELTGVAELVVTQAVAAASRPVWDALTDWDVHHRWMLFTRAEGGHAEGESLAAFTGVGQVGFLDTMVITVWEPPRPRGRPAHRHGGARLRRVRGRGRSRRAGRGSSGRSGSTCRWVSLGRLGWPLVRLPLRRFVQLSLKPAREATSRAAGEPGRSPARTGCCAARGAPARPTTRRTTTRSGAGRCTATPRCSSGSASRRSSPGCPG